MTGRPINTNQISSLLDTLLRKHGLYKEDVTYKLNKIMDNLRLNKEETKKWLKNLLVFTSPILGIFFAQLALGVELKKAFLVALLAFYGMVADYFKKLKKK